MDPPRKGCSNNFLNILAKAEINKIVYVSCNPATLARDVKVLTGKGYSIEKIQPIDMFPHTYHCESVCLLQRKN